MFGNDQGKVLNAIASAENIRITGVSSLHGGSINQVLLLKTTDGPKVLKLNEANKFPAMFEMEQKGLEILKNSDTFKIPEVFSCGTLNTSAYLLLEYIPSGRSSSDFWMNFAQNLAALHRNPSPYFGFSRSNYIGSLPQTNTKSDNASAFYISQRLVPQFELAKKNGFSFQNMAVIFKNIETVIPHEPASLIHGDLWNGNYLVHQSGAPCLIDPAVCYAPREMDLAMMRLFGGFPEVVFSVYNDIFPLQKGFEQRVELWQLYYILVHLNIFGQGYYPEVRRILKNYE